jgi:hypothetical protein
VRVILVVLALIWVVALTPTILRKLAEREFSYSVARFHRSQRAMRRVGTGQVAMAGAGAGAGDFGSMSAARRVALHSAGRGRAAVSAAPLPTAAAAEPFAAAAPVVRQVGPSAQRRRRVLTVLAGGLVGSFLFGFVPGLAALWDLSLAMLLLTAGYVGLLVHFRRVSLERSEKVVYLEAPAAVAPAPATPRVLPFRPADSGRAPAFRIVADRPTPVAAGG